MSTREENLEKINAELEKLTDEELEQVAGGAGHHGKYKNTLKLVMKARKELAERDAQKTRGALNKAQARETKKYGVREDEYGAEAFW